MSQVRQYRLIDKDGHSIDQLYDEHEYSEAEFDAKRGGYAIEALIYELSDTELVWTPDGSSTWPSP